MKKNYSDMNYRYNQENFYLKIELIFFYSRQRQYALYVICIHGATSMQLFNA